MSMIETRLGMMEENELTKLDVVVTDDEWRCVTAEEWYRQDDPLPVKRNVTVVVKKMPGMSGAVNV